MGQTGTIELQTSVAARRGLWRPSAAVLGALAAWVAVVLYAASNSIVNLLVDIGAANPVAGGRNAITYTNLYLLGSLLSVVPMALLYRRDLTRANLRRLTHRHWRLLVISAVLSSVITPALFFYALEHTTVTNVVLVGRIEPPLFLLATWFFLRERLNPWAMLAGLIALAGAVVIIGTGGQSGGLSLGKGEWATVAATLSFIASTIVTRAGLRDVPMGIFAVFRTVIGASLYLLLVSAAFGTDQLQDVFAPVLWQWVWVYAALVIVLGQIAWNFGLKHARAGDVALATSFSPLAAILIAMTLLGEDPGPGLIPGASLILIAIVIGNLGRSARHSDPANSPEQRPRWETPEWVPPHGPARPLSAPLTASIPPDGSRRIASGRAGPCPASPPPRRRKPSFRIGDGGFRPDRFRPPSARLSSGPR